MSASLIRVDTELPFNLNPRFTTWLVKSDALHEPFVLIDVGVLGGEHSRWHFLGDHLVIHGFDASKEAVDDLLQRATSSNRHFHWLAIGNEDGERTFYFNPADPSSSRFRKLPNGQARVVPVRRLDTLLKQGVIPQPDFLKVDVEGHERELFLGASDLLAAGLLGVDTETSFVTEDVRPEAGFTLIHRVLMKHGLVISDLNFNRIRRENYLKERKRRGLPELVLEGAGKPATFNVLFCRDPAAEVDGDSGIYYETLPPPARLDQILKLMAIYELYGLNDVAVEIAMKFKEALGRRLDVDRAIDLLCDNDGGVVREYLAEVRKLKSSLAAARRGIHALRREVAASVRSKGKLAGHVVEELANLKAVLNPVIVAGNELSQPHQYTYEGHAEIDAFIPEDPKDVTRAHGASILRIAPQVAAGAAELHVRVLLNCYCSETNAVRIAVFEGNSGHAAAVLTEDLIAAEMTLVDQDAFISFADASHPLVFEIRVGLAHTGGILSLNHVPTPALASAVRFRWLPVETAPDRLLAEREWIASEHEYLVAKRDERRAQLERLLAERDRVMVEHERLLAERDGKIADHERLLAERDGKIAEHERLLADRDGKIAEHERLLAERDGKIAEHERLLAERDGRIADQKRLIAERSAALAAIQNSRTWRLTAPLRRVMSWLRH